MVTGAVVQCGVGIHTVDDAYITFRYADHLSAGSGLVYNVGEKVLGTSSPLFAILLALFGVVKISAPAAAFFLSLLASLAIPVFVFRSLAHAGFREGGYFAAAIYAVAPFSVTYAVSGMETSLYLALVLALLAYPNAPSWRMAILSFLCLLCRPDGALAVGILYGVRFFRDHRRAKADAVYLAALSLPWLIFLQLYYGQVIPQSVLAKAHLKSGTMTSLLNCIHFFGSGWVGVQTLFFFVPGIVALKKGSWAGPVKIWLGWGLLYAGVFLAANAFTDFAWYFAPLFLLQTVVSGCGIAFLIRKTFPKMANVICFGLLAAGAANAVRLKRNLTEFAAGREALYRVVATELSLRSRPNAKLAATEVGTLGYYFPGPVLDLVGLVSPQVVKLGPAEALRRSHADWLVSYDTHLPFPDNVWFAGHFIVEKKIPVTPYRNLLIFHRTATP